jgi:hypothetical protein
MDPACDRLRIDAGVSDAFGSSTLKAFRPVHSSKLHHLFSRLSLAGYSHRAFSDLGANGCGISLEGDHTSAR